MTKELTAMIAEVRASIKEQRDSIFYWMTRTNQAAASARALLGTLKEQLTADITTLDKIAAAVKGMGAKPDESSLVKDLRKKLGKIAYHASQFLMHEKGGHTAGFCNRLAEEAEDILNALERRGVSEQESVTQPTPPAEMDEFDYQRIRQWALSEFRERANLAFTAGTNRNVAYLIEELFARPAVMDEVRAIKLMAGAMREDLPSSSVFDPFDPTGTKWAEAVTTAQAEKALKALKQIATITAKEGV